MGAPYHKYVFDEKNKSFVGEFNEMYKNETIEGYDSWHGDDLRRIDTIIAYAILNQYHFSSILDIGCGKGAFTSLLKKKDNSVKGIDISEIAISRCKATYPDISFEVCDINNYLFNEFYDAVIMRGVLSYIKEWKNLISKVAVHTNYLYTFDYIPVGAIGFVKSFDELTNEICKYFMPVVHLYDSSNMHLHALWKIKSGD